MTVQERNAELVKLLQADFQGRFEPQFAWAMLMETLRYAPGLRGLWSAGVQTSGGNLIDQSGQGGPLVYNGNPFMSVYNEFVPIYEYDGIGDYHLVATSATNSIIGNEATIATARRGLSWGGIWRYDNLKADNFYLGKWIGATNQRQFLLYSGNTGAMSANVSSTGANNFSSPSITVAAGQYFMMMGRYTPSTEVKIFVNSQSQVNTTAIPATLFAATSGVCLMAESGGGGPLDGACAVAWLAASAWSDAFYSILYNYAKGALPIA